MRLRGVATKRPRDIKIKEAGSDDIPLELHLYGGEVVIDAVNKLFK